MTRRAEQMLRALLVLATVGAVTCPAGAQVVCLGASNTRGMGMANEAAYPVQLEAMLRAKGYRGRVLNSGISGDTTAGMLARLDSAVPPDTRVVILQPSRCRCCRAGSKYREDPLPARQSGDSGGHAAE